MSDRTAALPAGAEVRVLGPDDWQTWREIRLRSLVDAPEAFGSTLEREEAFEEAHWRQRLESVSVVVTVDGEPVALGGGFRVREGWMQVIAMWTDPAYRRRGLSLAILDVVVAAARAEGLRLVLDVAHGQPGRARPLRALRIRGDRGVRADPAGLRTSWRT